MNYAYDIVFSMTDDVNGSPERSPERIALRNIESAIKDALLRAQEVDPSEEIRFSAVLQTSKGVDSGFTFNVGGGMLFELLSSTTRIEFPLSAGEKIAKSVSVVNIPTNQPSLIKAAIALLDEILSHDERVDVQMFKDPKVPAFADKLKRDLKDGKAQVVIAGINNVPSKKDPNTKCAMVGLYIAAR
ncbi:MAG: hypothetical protein RIQ56_188 [Candidatus Parcubacteria bacterium]|jgi:hypothetical protein